MKRSMRGVVFCSSWLAVMCVLSVVLLNGFLSSLVEQADYYSVSINIYNIADERSAINLRRPEK